MTVPADVQGAVAGPLWEHQIEAVTRALRHDGYMLAHDMGAGKSATAVAIAEVTQAQRMVVLCPLAVVDNWPRQMHGPLDPPAPVDGWATRQWVTWSGVLGRNGQRKRNPSVKERASALEEAWRRALARDAPLLAVLNYEAIFREPLRGLLEQLAPDLLVLDESHRIKSPSGRASLAARHLASGVRGRGGRVLALTGTPLPHTPFDLWAQFRAIAPHLFPVLYPHFCARYGRPETIYLPRGRTRQIYRTLRPDARAEFERIFRSRAHRVRTRDVRELPEATDRIIPVELSRATRRAYDTLEADGVAELEAGTLHAANAMVLVTRLRQATSGFGRDPETEAIFEIDGTPAKSVALRELLTDLPSDEPVVVFCNYHRELDYVSFVAGELGRAYGELSGRRRDGMSRYSTIADHVRVLGVQIRAGGVGVDFTAARYAVYMSYDFQWGNHNQSRARLVRPGQRWPVLFFHLVARDTIDEVIMAALAKRGDVIEATMEALGRKLHGHG